MARHPQILLIKALMNHPQRMLLSPVPHVLNTSGS